MERAVSKCLELTEKCAASRVLVDKQIELEVPVQIDRGSCAGA